MVGNIWRLAIMVMRLVTYADIVAILAIWGFVDLLLMLILKIKVVAG